MAQWLGHWIPNLVALGSKPLGDCSKVGSQPFFILTRSIKYVPEPSRNLAVKIKLSRRSGSVGLRQLDPHP